MKINLVSDLHLEFCPIELPGGETLFLAGDITVADHLRQECTDRKSILLQERTDNFFKMVSERYAQTYYIMGNHEHYHGTFQNTHKLLRDATEGKYSNIKFLNNYSVPLTGNLMVFGGTLWTNYNKENPLVMENAFRCMNDHHTIAQDFKWGNTYARFMPNDAYIEHNWCISRLTKELALFPDKDFVVMTHHCPTFKSIHPKYGTDLLNYAFSSDLSEFILDNPRIKYWVHGHTHDTFKYAVGDCQVLCNPRGYTRNPNVPPENVSFDPNFFFEVS